MNLLHNWKNHFDHLHTKSYYTSSSHCFFFLYLLCFAFCSLCSALLFALCFTLLLCPGREGICSSLYCLLAQSGLQRKPVRKPKSTSNQNKKDLQFFIFFHQKVSTLTKFTIHLILNGFNNSQVAALLAAATARVLFELLEACSLHRVLYK